MADDADVPDVAGSSLRAPMQQAVRDQPGSDAGTDLQEHDVVMAEGRAVLPLAERHDVDVVVDPYGRVVARCQPLADRVPVPARHDRRRDRPPGRKLHGARDANADAAQGTRPRPPRLERVEQRFDPADDRLRAIRDVCGLLLEMQHRPVEVRDGNRDAGGPEVRDEQVPRLGVEAKLPRWPAARAGADSRLRDEAAIDKLGDALRHDGARQAGSLRNVEPGTSASAAHRIEDGRQRRIGEHRATRAGDASGMG